jgi:serine/threonine protein kinase
MRTPAPLAGRYKFARSIQAGTNTLAWLATDEQFGKQVVACALGEVRLRALERAVGVEHTYLATILDLVRAPPTEALPDEGVRAAAVAIAEYVPGLTLYEQLKEGALPANDAVTMIARAAEGVQALHAAGAVHGSISPRTLVIAPSAARPAPVLAQLVAPTSGAYSTPERLDGGGPTPENDVWALYAMLYAALSGVPAFEGASKEELSRNMREQKRKTLAELSVDRPELEALIAEGLAGAVEKRRSNLGELLNGLTAWIKNRDALTAEAAELARLSMDWEDQELPGTPAGAEAAAAPTPAPPTPGGVDYPMFTDEDADVATTVFRPGEILEAAAALLADPPPQEPRFHRPRQLSIFIPEPPLEPALSPAALLAEPPPPEAAVSTTSTPSKPSPSDKSRAKSKPPPLPSSSKLLAAATSAKPRHPNKRRAMDEKALEDLRSEAAPLGNEEQAAIPMFPLEALYDQERKRVPDSPEAAEQQNPESESSPDAAGAAPSEALEQKSARASSARRDTGMVSRAPPKPADQAKPQRASKMARKAAKREATGSRRPEPRRDSKPWHDLTVPSKARRAEREEAARALTPPRKQASPWVWIVGVLAGLTAVAITALELERRSGSGKPTAPPGETREQSANVPSAAPEPMVVIPKPATDAESSVDPDAALAAEAGVATNPLGVCAASYFPPGSLTGAEDFAFLCGDADFRGATSQLHRLLVVAGAGNVSEGMREWATLGWYELGVAAVVRARCCPDAGPINLPSYSSDACKPMPDALAAVAREPMSPSDVPDRAGALAADIRCLYLNGIPRPYHYGVQPSGANRLTFEAFLTRIAARPR